MDEADGKGGLLVRKKPAEDEGQGGTSYSE